MLTREEKNEHKQDEIEQEKRKEKAKIIIKKIIKIIFIIFLLVLVFILYTRYSVNEGLIVKEKRLVNSNIPSSFNSFKIIQFSDLQYGSTVSLDEVDNLVKIINERNPNLILFTGDLIDNEYNIKSEEIEKLIKKFKNLNADIGKYAVNGDEDNDNFTTILTQAGFTVLDNSYDLIYNRDNNPILLVGLSSSQKNRDIKKAFSYYEDPTHNSNIYSILMMHEADSIDEIIPNYKVSLALAGGNLNGQIRIPKIGGIIKREKAEKYLDEYYELDDTLLYISSGIGTDNNQIRLFNRPSINFFRLAVS